MVVLAVAFLNSRMMRRYDIPLSFVSFLSRRVVAVVITKIEVDLYQHVCIFSLPKFLSGCPQAALTGVSMRVSI
tara:strand:- start:1002 stop:1223 length:222 start_codon:yes stop_codon:yes gene_type:complete